MTKPKNADHEALPLPGLESVSGRGVSNLEQSVRRTIAELNARHLISESDSGKIALALELAQIIDLKRSTGKVSTVSNDARVLLDLLDSFNPGENGGDVGLANAMAEWTKALGLSS